MPLFYKTTSLSSNESGPFPTLLLLHGRGSDENDLFSITPFIDPRFFIVSIRAPYGFPYGGYTWFDFDETNAPNIDQLLRSRASIFECLKDIQQKYPIDQKQIFLLGFSMGATMSFVLSLSEPNLFKGIVAHSGWLFQHNHLAYRWSDLRNLTFFIAHGTFDPVVPIELGKQAYQKLLKVNAGVIFREYPIHHTMSNESIKDADAWLRQHLYI